jgi:hypothetical protein
MNSPNEFGSCNYVNVQDDPDQDKIHAVPMKEGEDHGKKLYPEHVG